MTETTNYDDVLAALADEGDETIAVNIDDASIPCKRPDRYEYFKLLMRLNKGEITHEELAVQFVKLVLPSDKLTDGQVFAIMVRDGFFEGRGELLAVMEKYGRVLNPNDAFKAGNSAEADEGF